MSTIIRDVDESTFADEVLARSYEVPVVVDFWAEWCGPCRTLGPILEDAIAARDGDIELAKVDVDSNQTLAMQFQVQGIPAVKVFKNGQVVTEFTGAQPAPVIEKVLDSVMPTQADKLVRHAATLADGGDVESAIGSLEVALDLEENHTEALVALATQIADDDPNRARQLAGRARPDPRAEALLTQLDVDSADGTPDELSAQLALDPADVETRLTLAKVFIAREEPQNAVEVLLDGVRQGGDVREPSREQLVSLFGLLGDADPIVAAARPRLANALY